MPNMSKRIGWWAIVILGVSVLTAQNRYGEHLCEKACLSHDGYQWVKKHEGHKAPSVCGCLVEGTWIRPRIGWFYDMR